MAKLYQYVGPRAIAERAAFAPAGLEVGSEGDAITWLRAAGIREGSASATFVVDARGRFRLADRHSEHVACAGGGPVLAAGEIVMTVVGARVLVEEVSNQSTGYCPEPESWVAVAEALRDLGIEAPGGYTTALVFRRCEGCGQTNVVKDGVFECAVCGAVLPADWNLGG